MTLVHSSGIHAHPIERSSRTNDWRCDGCQSQGHSGARYRSVGSACDFDLCQTCWDAARVFKWDDVRASPSKTVADALPPLLSLHAVASEGYHQLPEAWRHDGWLPASARRRNTSRCGFPYLQLDGNTVLRSNGSMTVGTVFLVVRFPPNQSNPPTSAPPTSSADRTHAAAPTAPAAGTARRSADGASMLPGAGCPEGNSGGGSGGGGGGGGGGGVAEGEIKVSAELGLGFRI